MAGGGFFQLNSPSLFHVYMGAQVKKIICLDA
jgi:hypothetical protein